MNSLAEYRLCLLVEPIEDDNEFVLLYINISVWNLRLFHFIDLNVRLSLENLGRYLHKYFVNFITSLARKEKHENCNLN